ncbi:MAG: ribosome assembly cofactor RimP [Bacteroidales bacterium]
MIKTDEIQKLVNNYIVKKNMFLVDVIVSPGNVIQVCIDSFEGVDIDTCVDVSKYIESQLDRDVEDFELQVSSAGLTQPFKVHKQYEKHKGTTVCVHMQNGDKRTGILQDVTDKKIVLEYTEMVKQGPKGKKREKEHIEHIPFTDIKQTTRVITTK